MRATAIRDVISLALAIFGGVVMFAKISSYSRDLIGSWAGALGVLATIGLVIFLISGFELLGLPDNAAITEFSLWLATAVVIVASLGSTTTETEFIASGALIGVSWFAQLGRGWWRTSQIRHSHALHAR